MKWPSLKSSSGNTLSLALIALTVALYANSLWNGFTIDDEFVYSQNHFVHHLSNLPHLFNHSYFQYSNEASYRPVCTLTYFLDAALWRNWTAGPHITNLVLYIGIVLLLFRCFESITHHRWAAFLGAVLFAIHPIHTEVVDNISYREDLLIALWLPAAWLLYKRSEKAKPWLWIPLAWVCFFLGTLSKEMAVMFPLLVLLLELTEADGRVRTLFEPRRLVFMTGLLALSFLFVVIRFHWMQFPGEAHLPRMANLFFEELRMATKINAYYIFLFLWPARMHVYYPRDVYAPTLDPYFFLAAGTLLVVMAFLVHFRRERYFVLGVFWWFLCLAPVSNIYPIFNPMAERYLFLPSIGLCLWLGWLIARAMELRWRPLAIGVASVLGAVLVVLTVLRTTAWHDNFSLWRAEAQKAPLNPVVLANLARADYQMNHYEQAVQNSMLALRVAEKSGGHLNPGPVYLCLGSSHFMLGNLDLASENLKHAESYIPMRSDIDTAVYRDLGLLYEARNDLATALQYYRKASAVDPFQADLWRKIAYCEWRLGDTSQAQIHWQKARDLNPSLPPFAAIETMDKESQPQKPTSDAAQERATTDIPVASKIDNKPGTRHDAAQP